MSASGCVLPVLVMQLASPSARSWSWLSCRSDLIGVPAAASIFQLSAPLGMRVKEPSVLKGTASLLLRRSLTGGQQLGEAVAHGVTELRLDLLETAQPVGTGTHAETGDRPLAAGD